MLSPVELEIELFCRGMRLDESCNLDEDGRRISRTRAGLGSGLEVVLPAPRKPIWVNVPVVENFVSSSPFRLVKQRRGIPDPGRTHGGHLSRRDPGRALVVFAADLLGRRDVPRRSPPGELSGHLRFQLLPLLVLEARPRLQVLHDRKERGSRRAGAQVRRGRGRGGPGGPRRVGVGLHALEHRLPLRRGGQAGTDPRPAAIRAVRQGGEREGRRIHRSTGHAGSAPDVPRIRRADRRGHRPFLLLLRIRGPGSLRAPLPGESRDARAGGLLRGDGVHIEEARARTRLGRDHRRPRADRGDQARHRPDRRRRSLSDRLHLPSDGRKASWRTLRRPTPRR